MKRIVTLLLALTMSFTLASCYSESDIDDARQEGYDEGYEIGYDEGYDAGHSEGYAEGESAAAWNDGNIQIPKSTDEAPAGTVFVTQTGDKYHENGCRHISGKYNLIAYSSASEAEACGYTPCSVCH